MKVWTYKEMSDKVMRDLDLEDETFVSVDEMVGYFNEALNEAESEIMVLNQDYFLTKYFVPFVSGSTQYVMPYNCYANKIRGLIYQSGTLNYEIVQYRRKNKFLNIALTTQFGASDDYRYLLINDRIGKSYLEFHPSARETAVLAPVASQSTPVVLWYIRNCARIPITGEYCNPELVMPTQVSASANSITTLSGTATVGTVQQGLPGGYPGSIAYITGDAVKLSAGPNGTVPAPLVDGTVYYVIATGSNVIKLATTYANAILGTAIDLTDVGTVYFTISVAATQAIIDAALVDIPEFSTFVMQWVKCRCMEKDLSPMLEAAAMVLMQQKQQMVDTLTQAITDDDDEIQADYTHYQEMT